MAVTALGWQFESGRFGIGERPVLATAVPRDVTPPPGSTAVPLTAVEVADDPVRLDLVEVPALGRVGLDQPCPETLATTPAVAETTCAVHVDLGGMFATSRSPGRLQLWCHEDGLRFQPATVIEHDVRFVGTATQEFRTVLVLEIAASEPGARPTFATLRRDPSASGTPAGCPTLQELGEGLAVDHEVVDPYSPTPEGVPLLLSVGGVAVRPSSVGVELVRLTPEVTPDGPQSAAGPDGGGD